jgi:tRNA-Thr(GGU) m(6)t(6)A37 methyltransferase TsaA
MEFKAIGVIHSPFKELNGMPIQPRGASGILGSVNLFPEYTEGLKDIDGFSHVILIYHLHRAGQARMTVVPFLDTEPHGVFATRAPTRPNPIGLSIVKLIKVDGNTLHVENLDILDGTPLLDIKPYVPDFDDEETVRVGWLEQARGRVRQQKSDERFR